MVFRRFAVVFPGVTVALGMFAVVCCQLVQDLVASSAFSHGGSRSEQLWHRQILPLPFLRKARELGQTERPEQPIQQKESFPAE